MLLAQVQVPEELLKALGQLAFVVLFVLLPILQKKRERGRKPTRGAEPTATEAEAEPEETPERELARRRGEDLWRELLEGRLPASEPEPEPLAAEPTSAHTRHTRPAMIGGDIAGRVEGLPELDEASMSLEEGLEAGTIEEGSERPVSVFDVSRPVPGAGELVSLDTSDIGSLATAGLGEELAARHIDVLGETVDVLEPAAEPAPALPLARTDWRRAIVLGELLSTPLALRESAYASIPGLR